MAEPHITLRSDGSVEVDGLTSPTRVLIGPDGPAKPMQDPSDIGYPDIIMDQPRCYQGFERMTGVSSADATMEHVLVYWDAFLERNQRVGSLGPGSVTPYINSSRWVADCVCGGGMLCWTQNPYCACLDCGRLYACDWPLPATRSAIIRALEIRPPQFRNWDPRRLDKDGEPIETLDVIRRENTLMLGREE